LCKSRNLQKELVRERICNEKQTHERRENGASRSRTSGETERTVGGVVDLQGVNELVTDLHREIIEMMYDEELKDHLGFAKNDPRPGDSRL
jgi:hypothetical protein